MKTKTLMALAIGAALALPWSAMAQDKPSTAAASASAGASGGVNSPQTQAGRDANSAVFKDLDVNNDGHVSKWELKGTPYARDFARLNKSGHKDLLSYQEFSELNVGSASVGSGLPAEWAGPGGRAPRGYTGSSAPSPR
jgi:hypothetical protein